MAKRKDRTERELHDLKVQALELIEWTVRDLSPLHSSLHIKCGIEREGHSVPMDLLRTDKSEDIFEHLGMAMDSYAKELLSSTKKADKANAEKIERIYHDTSGPFIIEMVTKPLGLHESAKTTMTISKLLEKITERDGRKIEFGSMPTNIREYLSRTALDQAIVSNVLQKQLSPRNITGDNPFGEVLVGRGQHANISLWLDKQNLFSDSQCNPSGFMDTCGKVAINMLPDFIMPLRNHNYDRIKAKSQFCTQHIDMGKKKVDNTAICQISRQTPQRFEDGETVTQNKVRLEFRAAAAIADPYDVVLSAGAPIVKTMLDHCPKDENGKILLDTENMPVISTNGLQAKPTPMPEGHEEAAALFNQPNNTYFELIDRLAKLKISQSEARYNKSGSNTDFEIWQRDKGLLKLGSRMHSLYCKQEGMESVMPQHEAGRHHA